MFDFTQLKKVAQVDEIKLVSLIEFEFESPAVHILNHLLNVLLEVARLNILSLLKFNHYFFNESAFMIFIRFDFLIRMTLVLVNANLVVDVFGKIKSYPSLCYRTNVALKIFFGYWSERPDIHLKAICGVGLINYQMLSQYIF